MSDKAYVAVTDEELQKLVESGLRDASGDWLSGTTLSAEREKATLEYGMLPTGHLAPQGVSQIVSSDTVEAIEGYTAIIAELLFNNNKIAKFKPLGKTPTHYHQSKVASEFTNYAFFKMNPGWALLNTWTKSALMYKNSLVRWDFVEDHEYKFEEYEVIDQNALDLILSEEHVEPVGTLTYEPQVKEINGEKTFINVYKDVRLRRKCSKSRVKIENVPTENLRVSKDASSLQDATFVGIETEVTRGEARKLYPDADIQWDKVAVSNVSTKVMSSEEATRKILSGVEAHAQGRGTSVDSEANTPVALVECWIRVDRDGDGIAELKHLIYVGGQKVSEEDTDCVQLASFCPFEIPYEFIGLSMADIIRPSTLATTAVMRGFVENVYMTNYSPKLADPNVVDFSALQNMKPKQLIATNGNPQGAVFPLTPDTISQGTVPLLEYLQIHKEQATGLSKAAQGLNDVLYVSGNSEQKVAQVQSAAQVRIQYMARRFVETGIKPLVEGVYKLLREKLKGSKVDYYDAKGYLQSIDPAELPETMLLEVDADVGDMGSTAVLKKMEIIGKSIIPALQEAGAGNAVSPQAAVKIAAETLVALDVDPLDYMVDYTTEDFIAKVEKSREAEQLAAEKAKQLEEQIKQLDIEQRKGTIALTNIQSKNAMQDNARQMVVAMDDHYKEWAKLQIQAAKDGVTWNPSLQPSIENMWAVAMKIISQDASAPLGTPQVVQSGGPAADVAPPGAPGGAGGPPARQ